VAWVYFLASPDNATQRYLYRIGLEGGGGCNGFRLLIQPGTHGYDIS
jgi:dipeptidyl-peptidase-4